MGVGAGISEKCFRSSFKASQIEMAETSPSSEVEWHEEEDRGSKIAFAQGKDSKKIN